MVVKLKFLGAAGTVTGSKFLLEQEGRRTMVDCGLYQGERAWRRLNWQALPVSASSISDVILTHAHLDHCGHLPALVREGFTGPTWCTQGTASLAAIVLRDSAYLQEEDAENARLWGFSRHNPPRPLYDAADAEKAIASFKALDYHQHCDLRSGAHLSFSRAGHILGSASALVTIGTGTVLFSGDLGRTGHPLLLAREAPPAARTVVIESTYGDRAHPADDGSTHEILAETICRTVERGGSVLIPAFAVDRTELVLHALSQLAAAGAIPAIPVYVDSPMALAALDVSRGHGMRLDLRPDLPARLVDLPDLHTAHSAQRPGVHAAERTTHTVDHHLRVRHGDGRSSGTPPHASAAGPPAHRDPDRLPGRRHTRAPAGRRRNGTEDVRTLRPGSRRGGLRPWILRPRRRHRAAHVVAGAARRPGNGLHRAW